MEVDEVQDEVIPRDYQIRLMQIALERNTIIYLPTGTGKTFIAIMVIKSMTDLFAKPLQEGGKLCFLLVNTVALVEQHSDYLRKLTHLSVGSFSGDMQVDNWNKRKWQQQFDNHNLFVMTTQILLNIVEASFLSLSDVGLLIFDECHRGVNDHAMRSLMMKFKDLECRPKVLGLTATLLNANCTPDSVIKEVRNIETTFHSTVATVECLQIVLGYSTNPIERFSFFFNHTTLQVESGALKRLEILGDYLTELAQEKTKLSQNNNASKDLAKIVKNNRCVIQDVMYHIETMGIYGGRLAVVAHSIQLERMKKRCVVHEHILLYDVVLTVFSVIKKMFEDVMIGFSEKQKIYQCSSSKVNSLIQIVKDYDSVEPLCALIFVQRRFTAKLLYNVFKSLKEVDYNLAHLNPDFAVGVHVNPTSDTREGLYATKMNKKVLAKFNNREVNLLVASNVLEEGIDIQICSLVVKYDKPMDYRSYIQSKGRARHKNSFYHIMLESEEKDLYRKRFTNFQLVERLLNKHLVGEDKQRSEPSKEELKEMYDTVLLPSYFVNGPGSAEITMLSAISLLCRYCTSLPSDEYTDYQPSWSLETLYIDGVKHHRAIIGMPILCQMDPFTGPYMPTRKDAKRAAALKLCEQLHKMGELDDTLLPKKGLPEDFSKFFTHWKQNELAIGGALRKTLHRKAYIKTIQDSNTSSSSKKLYLHIIDLVPKFESVPTTLSDTTMYNMYTSTTCFGLVTSNPLPNICEFPIFVTLGEITVHLDVNKQTIDVTDAELYKIRNFNVLVYGGILGILKPFLLFDNTENAEVCLLVPVDKCLAQIDCKILNDYTSLPDQKAQPTAEEKTELEVSDENYLNKIVTPWYRHDQKQYIVTAVCTHLNAFSPFPSRDFQTFKSYFKEKYHASISHPDLPLLLVKGLSQRKNCLKPRSARGGKKSKDRCYEEMEEHLIPELCVKQDFPACLWVQAIVIPSCMYRIHNLLLAEQLRATIALETGMGAVNVAECQPLRLDTSLLNREDDKSYNKSSFDIRVINMGSDDYKIDNVEMETAIHKLNQDFMLKKLESEYPWLEKDEPVDIERNLHVTLMDVHDYENFICKKIDTNHVNLKNDAAKTNRLAITYDKTFVHKEIVLLQTRTFTTGPELADVYKALCAKKCNEIVDLERLETLGDSFLKFAVSLFIFLNYPKCNEGIATTFKGKLISNKNLYYAGLDKSIDGYINVSEFSPNLDWKPPGLCLPELLHQKILNNKMTVSSLFSFLIGPNEQITGIMDYQSLHRQIEENEENCENNDEDALFSICSFLNMQVASIKKVADSIEALLGLFFHSHGILGGFKMLKWLNVIPADMNIEDIMQKSLPNPIINPSATMQSVDIHLPVCDRIEGSLGYKFKNRAYLLQALTHASYSVNRITDSYERLEFLGDAILDFLITCFIYENCGDLDPGQLTDLRSALVNNITFAGYTVRHSFDKSLLFSSSKLAKYIYDFQQYQESKKYAITDDLLTLLEKDDLHLGEHVDVPKVLGDVFEALAGAVFLDSGMSLTKVWEVFYAIMHKEIEAFSRDVPKNSVRLLYENVSAHPEYSNAVKTDSGGVMVGLDFMLHGERKRVHGFGENKAFAKKAASKIALRLLKA